MLDNDEAFFYNQHVISKKSGVHLYPWLLMHMNNMYTLKPVNNDYVYLRK